MIRKIVVVAALALLVCPNFTRIATAQTEQAAPCKDIPSCVVSGFVVIGGIGYYIIKNTVTGVVQRVPAKHKVAPTHVNSQAGGKDPTKKGARIVINGISRQECQNMTRDLQKQYGGVWDFSLGGTGISSPERIDPNGNIIPGETVYQCIIERLS
ncbi:MAG: hypothetical protein DSM106950_37250 [Stigonema ocellatum SAG 48.90 = DSM 106950]|nr:hypothetical protein [Stigonema ocellatum SAG 48.90 = DSM 106950]